MVRRRSEWTWESLFCALCIVGITLCAERSAQAEVLTIGAAESLRPVLREALPLFESRYPSVTARVVYGPSVTQRQQIEQGAPLHVFLPASFDQIRRLQAQGLLIDGPPRVFARTTVVLIGSSDTPLVPVSFGSLKRDRTSGRIALADPATSALGLITAELMAGFDPSKRLAKRAMYAHHGGLVELVSTGEADLAIVYRVDAVHHPHVRILDEAPAGFHAPVEFGAAAVWTCPPSALPAARMFLDFMSSPAVQAILLKHGFYPPPPSGEAGSAPQGVQQP